MDCFINGDLQNTIEYVEDARRYDKLIKEPRKLYRARASLIAFLTYPMPKTLAEIFTSDDKPRNW